MPAVVDAQGHPVRLGKELGRGGEGTVYQVGPRHAAKLYHQPISPEKQEKIRCMAASCTPELQAISCWPEQPLFVGPGKALQGFLMPLTKGTHPLHHLYGPQHRKQCFPDKDWRFLLHSARNVAAAFAVVHAHGHVIGDVNPNLVYISDRGTVSIIDCDSFQIRRATGSPFLCEVGVPHFTPPELQTLKSFHGCIRTAEHDHFGLALLIFHLLLMGRHPFSGVFKGKGDLFLEEAIQTRRYAYAPDARRFQMHPPPGSVSPGILPPPIQHALIRAFTASGTHPQRPTARQWVEALDQLQPHLRHCPKDRTHVYSDHQANCPWCQHQQRFRIRFFQRPLLQRKLTKSPAIFVDIGLLRNTLQAIPSHPHKSWADYGSPFVPKRFIPRGCGTWRWHVYRVMAIISGSVLVSSLFWNPFLVLPLSGVVFGFIAAQPDTLRRLAEQKNVDLQAAWYDLRQQQEAWRTGDFNREDSLRALCQRQLTDLATYSPDSAEGKKRLEELLREKALNRHLQSFFLSDVTLSGIGAQRKTALTSFGIETAADLKERAIRKVPGFGAHYTAVLLQWRNKLAHDYTRRHALHPSPDEIQRATRKLASQQRKVSKRLEKNMQELNLLYRRNQQLIQQVAPHLNRLHHEVLQIEADLKSLEKILYGYI